MTAPITAAAVEAAARALVAEQGDDWDDPEIWQRTPSLIEAYHDDYRRAARAVLDAAAPHIRARVLDEVDAALRDRPAIDAWCVATKPYHPHAPNLVLAAYLRDTLTRIEETP